MISTLQRRGPDGSGTWHARESGFAMAHRRLAIVDLSPAGHQPMISASARWVIAYNGEIYNHLDLRRQLQDQGGLPHWRGHSDTETLLACIEAWGVEGTLEKIVGMFAFAIWDRTERELVLARDRMGEKPLYYGWQGQTFLFGSELDALKTHPAFTSTIDRDALALLLRHNYIPAPYSIYKGIQKLCAGSWIKITPGSRDVLPTRYWSLTEVAERGSSHPFEGTESDALSVLETTLGNAVRGQMMGDVPIGALLSGGVDSTAITAVMQANSAKPIRTFTIGFEEREFDEATHARAVASHLGTDHTEIRLSGTDALALVPQLPSMYSEPFADSSQLPTHLVMKLARQHVTVALSGDAGDELFGGYNRYLLAPKVWERAGRIPHMLRAPLSRGAASTLSRLPSTLTARFGLVHADDKLRKMTRILGDRNVRSVDDLYVSLVSEWNGASGIVRGGRGWSPMLDERSHWPDLSDAAERMMVLDGLTYLPDDILVKVDRAAMAASLETRAPFLDASVIDLAWSLPMSMKIRDNQGKWLLKRLVDRHVPRALAERPKMGFGIPLDEWLRGPLRDWAETLLAEQRLRREGFLNPLPIRKEWDKHLRRETSSGYRLWSVLMFQAWLESTGAA
jgi:asparagine synthase (glutamine-hydrolysing)